MKRINNILIRQLSDGDRESLAYLMGEVKMFQASKAVMQAVHAFRRDMQVIKRQAERIRDLECQNHILRRNSAQIVKSVDEINKLLSKRDDKNIERIT